MQRSHSVEGCNLRNILCILFGSFNHQYPFRGKNRRFTMTISATATHQELSPVMGSTRTLSHTLGSAVTGALAGHFFSIVSPGGGTLFGVVQGLSHAIHIPIQKLGV